MRRFNVRLAILTFAAALLPIGTQAAFHFMQIEQVIAGVNGDTTAQAIQLRMRSGAQNFVSQTRVVVVDATGSNPILLENMTTNVPNGQAGRRVLLATPNFTNYTNIPLVSDFVMDPIPSSYLAAGQLRFMDDFGTIYWSLSWGGSAFTGSTTGSFTNDTDGIFGPPVNGPLPSTSLQALQFTGAASAASTNNLAQYAVTSGAATFISNGNVSFTLVAPPAGLPGDFNDDSRVDAADYVTWRKTLNTNFNLGGNGDETGGSAGIVDTADYALWRKNFGSLSGGGSSLNTQVPEPAVAIPVALFFVLNVQRRRP